jgi:RHS repeat-associated protein
VQRSVFQHDDQLLAQLRREDVKLDTTLLATDQQRSVLNVLDASQPHPIAYTPYGHRPAENGLLSLLGFNGERPDPVTGHYLLGNGYRAFNPMLMRFNSPDSWSPLGEGGLNAYAYCRGDPVNREDRTGHVSALGWRWIQQNIKYVAGRGPKASTLGRLPVLSSTSTPIARTAAKQDEWVKIISSQQKTIEHQHKTIASQQGTIESAHATTQQLLMSSQHNFLTEIERLRTRVKSLHADLSFSAKLYRDRFPEDALARRQADIDNIYGDDGLFFSPNIISQPAHSVPRENADLIRKT